METWNRWAPTQRWQRRLVRCHRTTSRRERAVEPFSRKVTNIGHDSTFGITSWYCNGGNRGGNGNAARGAAMKTGNETVAAPHNMVVVAAAPGSGVLTVFVGIRLR